MSVELPLGLIALVLFQFDLETLAAQGLVVAKNEPIVQIPVARVLRLRGYQHLRLNPQETISIPPDIMSVVDA